MAKVTALPAAVSAALTDLLYVITDPATTPASKKMTITVLKTALTLAKGDVGLGNVDNTSDANKPVSTAQQTALDGKMNNVTISNKTDNYNVALSDFGNALTMNAATAKAFNLPADLTTVVGKTLTITKLGAGKVTVQANTGQTIADGTSAGTAYDDQATELSATIVLQVISTTQIIIAGYDGTWSTT